MAQLIEQFKSLLKKNRLPHALILAGPDAQEKVSLAWSLAKTCLCEKTENYEPCHDCGPCRRVEAKQSESVLWLEPQGQMIKLESAHNALEFLSLRRIGRARLVIVDQAYLLNAQATNALLKVVEEPPPATYFIFLVNEVGQLLPTLRSRAQVFRVPSSKRETLDASENVELRQSAIKFLSDCFNKKREGLESLLDHAKDRQSALRSTHILQELLRDWSVLGQSQALHPETKKAIQTWPAWESTRRVELWSLAHKMETDLAANVDKNLVFENFFLKVRHAIY